MAKINRAKVRGGTSERSMRLYASQGVRVMYMNSIRARLIEETVQSELFRSTLEKMAEDPRMEEKIQETMIDVVQGGSGEVGLGVAMRRRFIRSSIRGKHIVRQVDGAIARAGEEIGFGVALERER